MRAQSAGMAPVSPLKDAFRPKRLWKKGAVEFIADGIGPLYAPRHTHASSAGCLLARRAC